MKKFVFLCLLFTSSLLVAMENNSPKIKYAAPFKQSSQVFNGVVTTKFFKVTQKPKIKGPEDVNKENVATNSPKAIVDKNYAARIIDKQNRMKIYLLRHPNQKQQTISTWIDIPWEYAERIIGWFKNPEQSLVKHLKRSKWICNKEEEKLLQIKHHTFSLNVDKLLLKYGILINTKNSHNDIIIAIPGMIKHANGTIEYGLFEYTFGSFHGTDNNNRKISKLNCYHRCFTSTPQKLEYDRLSRSDLVENITEHWTVENNKPERLNLHQLINPHQ